VEISGRATGFPEQLRCFNHSRLICERPGRRALLCAPIAAASIVFARMPNSGLRLRKYRGNGRDRARADLVLFARS